MFCTKECKAEEGKEFLKYCVTAIQFSVCYAFIACIYLCMYALFSPAVNGGNIVNVQGLMIIQPNMFQFELVHISYVCLLHS